ncbi:MAG: nitrate reductase [Arcobacter sp.]|nr:nitrate reductase [Arcobacter sp.]
MKITKLALGLLTVALLFVVGEAATETSKKTVTEESLGLRHTDIYSETKETHGDKTEYGVNPAGTSKRFVRAYQDAPPMIPHDLEGLLPITIDNNACVGCHDPAVAPAMGATPIPKSHYIDFRPKHTYDGKTFTNVIDNMKNEIVEIVENPTLTGARFNCSQCHAPQTTGKLAVESTFEANYTREDGSTKSTWDEVILDNLNTLE